VRGTRGGGEYAAKAKIQRTSAFVRGGGEYAAKAKIQRTSAFVAAGRAAQLVGRFRSSLLA
jgi:hypothetical protein